MMPCQYVEIITPKKFLLNGLWFGAAKPKRVFIFVHGLGGSLFGGLSFVEYLADADTAVLLFNNRGHDGVSTLRHTDRKKKIKAGAAHEVFIDCVDDLQGAIDFAKMYAKQIYLVGHSTGCQKSIYWAHKKKSNGVNGIVLLAPISDYASFVAEHGAAQVVRAATAARALVDRGQKHALMPEDSCGAGFDAQRFLSLYTSDSVEEIFSYAQSNKVPKILASVRAPILVLLAEKDEYADRPAKSMATWFDQRIKSPHMIEIVPRATHNFCDAEQSVAKTMMMFSGK